MAMAARPYFGFICVVGFIALSGYCIARSTMRHFALGDYIVKRVTRVYPLLIVAALLTGPSNGSRSTSPHRPFMWILARDGRDMKRLSPPCSGFSGFKGAFGALAPAYTISFELFYYAIWGLAMKAAAGRGRRALLMATGVGGRARGLWRTDARGARLVCRLPSGRRHRRAARLAPRRRAGGRRNGR